MSLIPSTRSRNVGLRAPGEDRVQLAVIQKLRQIGHEKLDCVNRSQKLLDHGQLLPNPVREGLPTIQPEPQLEHLRAPVGVTVEGLQGERSEL